MSTFGNSPKPTLTAKADTATVQELLTDIERKRLLPIVLRCLTCCPCSCSRVFDVHPTLSARSRILLRRWVWRGATTGAHQGARASLREAIDTVVANEEHTLRNLLAQVPKDSSLVQCSAMNSVRIRDGIDRVTLCALAAREPRDLRTNRVFDAVPQRGVWSLPSWVPRSEGDRTWAFRVLHPPMSQRELLLALRAANAMTRASHVIRDEACAALLAGDVQRFGALRDADLTARLQRFLNAHAEWSASDPPHFLAKEECA